MTDSFDSSSAISEEKPAESSKTVHKKKYKNGEELYEIEAVLDHKIERTSAKKQIVLIKVKWSGYNETTWENFKFFAQDSPDCVQKYLINLDKKINILQ